MQLMGVGGLLPELMRWFREAFEGRIQGRDDQTLGERLVSTSQSIPRERAEQKFQQMDYAACAPVT